MRHQNRQEFFNYTIGKLDHYVGDLVKDEINKKNDGLVEDLVYGRIPMISSKVRYQEMMVTFRNPTSMRYWTDRGT